MRIEMWSDIICPICGLTQNRLHRTVAGFEHGDQVEVVHRSFQVHPGLPPEGVTQTQLSLNAGMTVPQMEAILRPIETAAEAEGFTPYRAIDRTLGPTDLTHELLAYATEKGKHHEAWTRMFRDHFGAGRQLWTLEQLVDFAGEIDLDREEARAVLSSRRYRRQVEAEQARGEQLGARGTPFTVIDGKYGISGGVDASTLLRAMERAWAETRPSLTFLGDGDHCGVDGACAV
ncbi:MULTISPECIES: DsbA family protein [unclassified Amycolatopsis]|uniref:DsbA family oxidoreductase n=1 Tax=unclassified Amycolatopsis TaxID=2618356 RepID=UPI001C6A892F|nr:DsbA family oxidoreductase [Amycolatopsis sp. DSM 110486]QYN20384.1 DsbA family oxidoreductase [Amycolatopsis sp. DSM 110486]